MAFDAEQIKEYWYTAHEHGELALPTHIIEVSSGVAAITHVDGPSRVVLIDHDRERVIVKEEE